MPYFPLDLGHPLITIIIISIETQWLSSHAVTVDEVLHAFDNAELPKVESWWWQWLIKIILLMLMTIGENHITDDDYGGWCLFFFRISSWFLIFLRDRSVPWQDMSSLPPSRKLILMVGILMIKSWSFSNNALSWFWSWWLMILVTRVWCSIHLMF